MQQDLQFTIYACVAWSNHRLVANERTDAKKKVALFKLKGTGSRTASAIYVNFPVDYEKGSLRLSDEYL